MTDVILGLPVHPLVVHVVVVILPLAAAGLIAIVLIPAWRRSFGWLVLAGLVVGAGGSLLAKESGESLAGRVGWPGEHADLGDRLPILAFALLAVAIAWFVLMRRDASSGASRTSILTRVVGVVGCVLAVASIALTVAVGHSGAVAVWQEEIAATESVAPSPSPTSQAISQALTMQEVTAHATADDCWTVVDGLVYDLTSWIDQHPGGAGPIEALCGVDGTQAFRGMHGTEPAPNEALAGFELGPLAP